MWLQIISPMCHQGQLKQKIIKIVDLNTILQQMGGYGHDSL
jgi:hypothetical protein